jgi:ORF6N domain
VKALCRRSLAAAFNRFREQRVLLDAEELATLRSQSVISNAGRGGRRTAPYAFTEQGVAMLSSVFNSDQAISVNLAHDSFSRNTRIQIKNLFDALSELANKPDAKTDPIEPPLPATPKRPIGFIITEEPSEP